MRRADKRPGAQKANETQAELKGEFQTLLPHSTSDEQQALLTRQVALCPSFNCVGSTAYFVTGGGMTCNKKKLGREDACSAFGGLILNTSD